MGVTPETEMPEKVDEFSDIIDELDRLQKEMTDNDPVKAAEAVVAADLKSQSDNGHDLTEEPAGAVAEVAEPDESESFEDSVLENVPRDHNDNPNSLLHVAPNEATNHAHAQSSNNGTLSMTLNGNMTLNLRYSFDGCEVDIGFEDQFLKVVLTDGTEFKIPVSRSSRKAA